ncbi:unnamed protein product [Callosobruchus maculatus]|uniref:MADF domain-containing protein n=1 Tax=Callosobruchus maculatus TaxID=64391 RepID=A0A653C823_CALMS|nr:unnamed protein product [Callosobruchus maculatus]
MEWNEDNIFNFIQKIQVHPCLWNPSDRNKKNRNKVHDAFKSIAEEMGSDNIEELKKKKENLFQTYRGYRRKVFCSQKSGAGTGDIYKPIWAPYSLLDNFLHGIYTPKGKFDTLDNLDANEDLNKDDEGRSDNDKDTSQMDFNENKNTEELSINDEKNEIPKGPAKRSSVKRPKKEQHRADMAFNDLLAIKETLAKRNSSCASRDECTVYCELLAIKLRKLDARTQRLAMHKIDTIMFDLAFDSSMLPSPRPHSSHSSYVIAPSSGASCAQFSPQSQPTSSFHEQSSSNYITLQPPSAVNEASQQPFSQLLQSSSQDILQTENCQSTNHTNEQFQGSAEPVDEISDWPQ